MARGRRSSPSIVLYLPIKDDSVDINHTIAGSRAYMDIHSLSDVGHSSVGNSSVHIDVSGDDVNGGEGSIDGYISKMNDNRILKIPKNLMLCYDDSNTRHYGFTHDGTGDELNCVVYPIKSNVKCFNCHHHFDTVPCFLPVSVNSTDDISTSRHIGESRKYVFNVVKNFCSFNCVIAYNEDHSESERYSDRSALINLMIRNIYGKDITLKRAEPIDVLTAYGGFRSIEEYREQFSMLEKGYELSYPPVTPVIPKMVETVDITGIFNKGKDKAAGNKYTVSRKKPLVH